ncbi:MAG: hypothetical protein Q8R02_18855 [Hyphomonadaceae bacterium]|nr:hypothetical protein [Hyphomonadaceae bacterium]
MRFAAAILLLALAPPATAQSAGDYSGLGLHKIRNSQGGPGCHVFRPADRDGAPYPVILWGNGTQAMVAQYSPMLRQWASHGFVVAGALTGSAGSGKPLLDCLDYLTAENARTGSALKGMADLTHVGASGHSQGGGGAIMAGRDQRVTATAPIQPSTRGPSYARGAETQQHGPMLLLSGGADSAVDPGLQHAPVFATANVPVVWATLKGAGHFVPSNGDSGPYRLITTAWWLYALAGDEKAAAMFKGESCGYCADPNWVVEKKNVE